MRRRRTQSFLRRHRRSFLPLLLACAGLWYAWGIGEAFAGLDFYQFWIGGQVAHRTRPSSFYSRESCSALREEFLVRAQTTEHSDAMIVVAPARRSLELYATPLLYTAFGIFPGHYDRDLLAYRFAMLAAYTAALLLLGAVSRFRPARSLLFVALILFLFAAVHSDLRVFNVESFQLLLLALWLWRTTTATRTIDSVSAGAVLAIAVLFKPNVALIVPFVCLLRIAAKEFGRLRAEAAGLLLGALASIVGSSLFFRSPRVWLDWISAAATLSREHFDLVAGNVAPALPLVEHFGRLLSAVLVLMLSAPVVVGIYRKRGRATDELVPVIAGLALVVSLASAPLVWSHYLVLALPLGYALMRDHHRAVQVAAALALSLVAAIPWETLLRVSSVQGEALLFWIGLGGLYAAGIVRVTRYGSDKRRIAITQIPSPRPMKPR